jgi:hypothetical protein
MAVDGFRLIRSLERYVLRDASVEMQFWTLTSFSAEGVLTVDPGVGIRHSAVEDIYHRCSGVAPKWQKHSPTYSIDLWRWVAREKGLSEVALRSEFVQRAESVDTAVSAAERMFAAYKQWGVEYFERYKNLAELDRLFNGSTETEVYGLAARNICTGLVVAKLIDRPDFQVICERAINRARDTGDQVAVSQVQCLVEELKGTR